MRTEGKRGRLCHVGWPAEQRWGRNGADRGRFPSPVTVRRRQVGTRLAGMEIAVLQLEPALQWLRLRPRVAFWTGLALVLILGFVIGGGPSWYGKHHAALAALNARGGSFCGCRRSDAPFHANLRRPSATHHGKLLQSRGATREQQARGALRRHLLAQADFEESPDDYWTVMENLTAFVRERSRRAGGAEPTVFPAAQAYEAAMPWRARRPEMAG